MDGSRQLLETPLWDGDTGDLDEAGRSALRCLLGGHGYIDGERDVALWDGLARNSGRIESILNDLYLTLEMSKDCRVAYAKCVDCGEASSRRDVYGIRLGGLSAVVCLRVWQAAFGNGMTDSDRRVSKHEIKSSMVYNHEKNDDGRFDRQFNAAWNRLRNERLLVPVGGDETDTFEVSKVLYMLIDENAVREWQGRYESMGEPPTSDGDGDDCDE